MDVPLSLRRWFVAHFVIDVVVGLPLLLSPRLLLGALGWTCIDPAAARLVGAALLAIGTQSFLSRNEGPDALRPLLNLNVIWSYAAIFALVAAGGQGAPPAAWALLSAFVALAGVWTHYRIRIKQMDAQSEDGDRDDSSEMR
jgi:4-hydroxybenzoate polyprenyltransferase